MKFSNSSNIIIKKNNLSKINSLLLNIHKYKLYPPPSGLFYKKPKINSDLNFSLLEPVIFKNKDPIIGDGSFSTVFLYHNKKSQIKYAIKKMNISLVLQKSSNKNIILNEINIQSKISHPNIIKLHNYFKDKEKENYYLILEYASKGTLFDYIRFKNGLNESNAFYYFIQAVNAIYFLHNNQIIHRDLKPENLLINHDDILKLCDFGWSVYSYNNKRETFCGTVEYMAPEILNNQGYDFSIDVWSLGVLLYELIHSHSPFVVNDLDINKIENNIVSKELIFKKGISSECKDLIKQLLSKKVENRIKIKDIYQHPFVLRYINMINRYIKNNGISKEIMNINNKNKEKKKLIHNNKDLYNNKELILNEEKESFDEFETIPNEPEPKKIGNFDIIVRKLTKIDNKISDKLIRNNNNLYQIIKNNFDDNNEKKSEIKKSLSLNDIISKKVIINKNNENLKNQKFNENKNKEKEKISEKDNKLNKLSKKKSVNKSAIKKQTAFVRVKNALINTYNNYNLLKTNYKKENKSNRPKIILNSNIKANISPSKKPISKENETLKFRKLITSYKVKTKNKLNKYNNKNILNNYTTTNINDLSKLNKIGRIKKVPNCKSISFIKNNNNKSHNFSIHSNSSINNFHKTKNKISKKKSILIRHLNTLNKNSNFSFNNISKLNSFNDTQKKLTLNLSNINVINVYNNPNSNEIYANSLNIPKIIQKINTFFIRDKTKNHLIIHQNKNIVNNNIDANRKKNKKSSCLNLKKLKNNSKAKRKKSQNIKRNKNIFMNFSYINKSENNEKKNFKSSRNIKISNPIPYLNLNLKQKKNDFS